MTRTTHQSSDACVRLREKDVYARGRGYYRNMHERDYYVNLHESGYYANMRERGCYVDEREIDWKRR